ncbi:MAG: two-component system response regulator [Rhodospirillaceae bacterium]|jgi:DNA-binding response OmpR family regulator|nr:two-component system response regulator [Rhodospirillaceae bacterium]|tara:strand:- start:20 stop:400 length:381 start_codon:yes stop_codon:yes gene_type:complete
MTVSVLIVEDEPNIVLSLEFLMENAGYEVRVARDGRSALEEVTSNPPNIILLDVMLPDQDGFSVCELIRTNPDLQNVRILMLTAKGRDTDREKGLALGADAYITKPFSTRDLVEKVKIMASGLAVN